MTEHAERLQELLSHAARSQDLAMPVCRIILDAPDEEQPDLFYRFILGYKHGESDETTPADLYFSEADHIRYDRVCKELLRDWMAELQAEYEEESDFHAALWKKIRTLTNETLRIRMVAACAESPALPYLSPKRLRPGAQFTAESFKDAVHALDPVVLQSIQHILHQESPHVAQDAAALLPLLEACPSQQETVVVLSVIILAMHEKIQLSELEKMLRKAANEAMDQMIRDAMEEWDA